MMAKMQEREIVSHSTGYKMSNFFTVVIKKSKDTHKAVEPEVFMVSDQGQALEKANMFVS